MILKFTVNIVCGDGLAFLLVGLDQLQVFDFYWNSGSLILCPSNITRCFCRKMGGRQGSDGQGDKLNLNFGRGYPKKKKVGKKWGGGREEKKWAGVGRLNPRVWNPPLHQTMTWADRYVMAQPKPMLTHHQWGQVTIICLIFYTDVMNIIFKKKS